MSELSNREKQITRTSIVGIIANIFLSGFKALVGLISGSIAIVLDAVNNLTDAMSSVITIVGVKLAKRKPDDEHPFGYGRVEYFSAIIISAIVIAAGAASLVESVKKIFAPEMPDYSVVTLVIVAVAIVVKLILGAYVKGQGKKYHSEALVASGADASFDAIISASTLISALITLIFKISLDGWFGAVISCFIIKAGLEMLLESLGSIIGKRPDTEVATEMKKTIAEIEGVEGAYDLVLHNYGPDSAIGTVHVEIADNLTAGEVHTLTKKIQLKVYEEYKVFMTVGIYALDKEHAEERKTIAALAKESEGVLGTHGIFINEEMKYISFDAVISFEVEDRKKLHNEIVSKVEKTMPGYTVELNFDTKYTD